MKKLLAFLLLYFMRMTLWFRYRVTIKGLENLNPHTLNKPGGVLFLPNHPTVFVDPTLVTLAIWRKYPIRPMIVEYMYYTPMIHWCMKLMNALPVPNFVTSSNSLKKKRADQVIETVIEDLKRKENFLIYPAGKVKHQAKEIIGASGVHRIIQAVPEANVVLVRTTGLWGSSFSRALTGKTPPMFATIFQGIKIALKNLIFFTPRREVTIEFVPADSTFPYQASRLEMNRYLEKWYNRPDGLTPQTGEEPGESLYLVSYSMWKEELPKIKSLDEYSVEIDLNKIPLEVQDKVKHKLFEMTQMPADQIKPDMSLSADLGLDSLDNAELIAFLDDNFDVAGVPVGELTTVGKVMALAAKQVAFGEQLEEEHENLTDWFQSVPHENATLPEGETLHEVFLNNCQRMGKAVACGDGRAGVITYNQAKVRVLLLADYIRTLPGEYIGILLPSSVAAYFTILACQLAGKIPLLINWTVGPRHLETVRALSKVQVVLSSWAFLDRLENVDLNGIEDLIVTLEDARRNFSLKHKLTAYFRSKRSTKAILSLFDVQDMNKHAKAVLLFTSGTENMPKGVPLTHENILSNQRAVAQAVHIYKDDILLGILPPFHSYGFTISGLLCLLCGVRVAYYADPTDGKGLARAIERWGATIICGAPTFLKGVFKNAQPEQLKSLRLCVSGAEKAPAELFGMVKQLEHCLLIEGYGITECSPVLTANMEGNPALGVGQPMPNVELCIVNIDTHQPIPQGQQGLILAKGPNIFSGYLNKGISTPFIFINGQQWYSTGDLGYLNPQGNLILSGRLKRFIKVGGEMVSLAAIEDALQTTIGQKAGLHQEEGPVLAVCAKEEAGEKTKIFVFTRFTTSIEEVNRSLKEAGFSNLVKVYRVQQLSEIPIMGTGKINYRALETQLSALNNSNELSKAT
ncbi:AMP-binding protein [Candidatus Protochlamydia phocaeensis]|uniref:AMP-binding protein n=1 Tax=Candidatus Protochlamydia phocaeensis TaxID=1414722 RepID=UPI000838537D|nr:AMP-binding protein [Candidatus Protochlamydia phocaeensis]